MKQKSPIKKRESVAFTELETDILAFFVSRYKENLISACQSFGLNKKESEATQKSILKKIISQWEAIRGSY